MNDNQSNFHFFEQFMTIMLFVGLVFFVFYLIMAGVGLLVMKVIFAILAIILSGVSIFMLYTSKELLKQRSLWLTTAFFSIILCTLVSLLCNYPAP